MTPEALEAERIALRFDLGYLSRDGFEKLARLIAWVRTDKPLPPEHTADIVKSPPAKFG